MDAYERSLKQQAERIKRELSKEGKTAPVAPKQEPPEEFIPSDVPSPIYGYARPKPKIVLPDAHSPETRGEFEKDETSVESFDTTLSTEAPFVTSEEEIEGKDQAMSPASNEWMETKEETNSVTDSQPLLGDVSITDDGFSSVFMSSTDLNAKKVTFVEEQPEVKEQEEVELEVMTETIGPAVEHVAERLQTESEQTELPDDTELTPAVQVSFKADTPPINVMMTPKDRMAMYRSRRLAQKNNNL